MSSYLGLDSVWICPLTILFFSTFRSKKRFILLSRCSASHNVDNILLLTYVPPILLRDLPVLGFGAIGCRHGEQKKIMRAWILVHVPFPFLSAQCFLGDFETVLYNFIFHCRIIIFWCHSNINVSMNQYIYIHNIVIHFNIGSTENSSAQKSPIKFFFSPKIMDWSRLSFTGTTSKAVFKKHFDHNDKKALLKIKFVKGASRHLGLGVSIHYTKCSSSFLRYVR